MQQALTTKKTEVAAQPVTTAIYAAVVAFLTYAAVYAYRKPFTIATFDGLKFWGIPYQTLLIISQVIGYMLSKFYGIKFIAELRKLARWKSIAILVGIAWLALLAFAITPAPWGMIFLLLNGFPLGLIWGIVFSYIEGRRTTDFIGSALAVSFIFSSGFVKSVAKWLMLHTSITEQWMPFATGAVFVLPMILFVYLLEKTPPPTHEDIVSRSVRLPMNKEDRLRFFHKFTLGLCVIIVTYLFLTVIRDIRDNFMANIWNDLGYGKASAIFTTTEIPTTLAVLLLMSLLVLVRKNIFAFKLIHVIILLGFLLAGISSWLFLQQRLDPVYWMTLVGLGLYTAYIPFNSIFFERMIASFKVAGNVGFLIYLADSFGYLGSVGVMLSKEIFQIKLGWAQLYPKAVVLFSIIGISGTLISYFYFSKKYNQFKSS